MLARKEEDSAFSMNSKMKHNWGSGSTVSPLVGSVGDHGVKL